MTDTKVGPPSPEGEQCGCGASYSLEQSQELHLIGFQAVGPDDEGPLTLTELRLCALCMSTLGVDHDLGAVLTRQENRFADHSRRIAALEMAT